MTSPQGRGRGPGFSLLLCPPGGAQTQRQVCPVARAVYAVGPAGHSLSAGYRGGQVGKSLGGLLPAGTGADSPGLLCSPSPACDRLHTPGGSVHDTLSPVLGQNGVQKLETEAGRAAPWGRRGGVRLSCGPAALTWLRPTLCPGLPLRRASPAGFRPEPHPPQPRLKLTTSTEAPFLNQVRVAGSGWT